MAYTNIDDSSAYFQTALYTGTGNANNAITNDGNSDLQPDFIWFKSRDAGHSHYVVDSSRGRDKGLYPDVTNSEVTSSGSTTDCQSFDTDGFTVGTPEDANSTNSSGSTKVAWQWKCNGGTTSTNTDGDINSTVQVNQAAGFSIVTYQPSNTTSRNIGHGLGTKPGFIWIRNRTRVENARVWNHRLGQGGAIIDNTSAYNTGTSNLVNTVTSTTFNVGSDFSVNGGYPIVAWCWAEKKGFSSFGTYLGNLNTDGPFVYTGFKPAWIMIKRAVGGTSSYSGWGIHDSKRLAHNADDGGSKVLWAHDGYEEGKRGQGGSNSGVTARLDILSNGFKIRDNGSDEFNDPDDRYMYFAFAENPFVTSTGIPTTAR
jgi:hypothetical protein